MSDKQKAHRLPIGRDLSDEELEDVYQQMTMEMFRTRMRDPGRYGRVLEGVKALIEWRKIHKGQTQIPMKEWTPGSLKGYRDALRLCNPPARIHEKKKPRVYRIARIFEATPSVEVGWTGDDQGERQNIVQQSTAPMENSATKMASEESAEAHKTPVWDRRLTRPDPRARDIARTSDQSLFVAGNVVEIMLHPNAQTHSGISLEESGWKPSEARFQLSQDRKDFSTILEKVGGLNAILTNDSDKFGLLDSSLITYDDDGPPVLTFYKTNYFTVRSVYEELESNRDLRMQYGNIIPLENRVPNATGLQFIVQFRNGDLLCLWRDRKLRYQGGKVSISGEEQIKDIDWASEPTAELLFRRACVEEVFGCPRCESRSDIDRAWAACKDAVRGYRLWGYFYEEAAAHFQLFGIYSLGILPNQLAEYHERMQELGFVGPDREGILFTISAEEQLALLQSGRAKGVGLYSKKRKFDIGLGNLHRTSLYRLIRLMFFQGRVPCRGQQR